MEDLTQKKCVPCKGGIPPLTSEEIATYTPQLKEGWKILEPTTPMKVDGLGKKLQKEFSFKDFKEAILFVNKVAEIAEQEQHHPNIAIDYSKVEITLWTHKIVGLHENDFILAAKIEQL